MPQDEESIVVVSPLVEFESDIDEIVISDKIRIKKITIKDESKVAGVNASYTATEYYVEIKCNTTDEIGDAGYLLITALRLFKTGLVGLEPECTYKKFPSKTDEAELGAAVTPLFDLKPLTSGLVYHLGKHEVDSFRKFFSKLQYRRVDSDLKIALWRFNRALQSAETEEEFIDFVVALEAVCLGKGEFGELGYRLSNRIATLLGDSEEKSAEVYGDVKGMYTLRSKILHGRTISSADLGEKTHRLETYVRKSIRDMLALRQIYTKKEKLLNKLDDALHNRDTKEKIQEQVREFYGVDFPE